ncbi:MAG: AmmeMemoRadiSam system protein B [Candidatus Anammoxibacter sp.]
MSKSTFLKLFSVLFIIIIFTPEIFARDGIIARHAAVAGKYYDDNPDALRGQIKSFLKVKNNIKVETKPIALISPHSGYIYSGLVAAHGYKIVSNYDYNRVIIIAPSHYGKRFRGVSVVRFTHYKTPLGLVEVDREICDKLIASTHLKFDDEHPLIGTVPTAHIVEHSIETQLPFLQVVLDDFKIVPLLIGYLKKDDYKILAKAIKPFIDKNTLIVTSSDFLHYGDRYSYTPFRKDIEKNINKYDQAAFNAITAVNIGALSNFKAQTDANICGFIPIYLLLHILPKGTVGQLLNYDTSGRQTGDFTYSVSYASIIFTRK